MRPKRASLRRTTTFARLPLVASSALPWMVVRVVGRAVTGRGAVNRALARSEGVCGRTTDCWAAANEVVASSTAATLYKRRDIRSSDPLIGGTGKPRYPAARYMT